MTKALPYSVFSVLLPFVVYTFLFLANLVPDRLGHSYVYLPLLIIHALCLFLSIVALATSVSKPIDVSPAMRLAVLLASIGILGNIIGIEYVLGNSIFHAVVFPTQ